MEKLYEEFVRCIIMYFCMSLFTLNVLALYTRVF